MFTDRYGSLDMRSRSCIVFAMANHVAAMRIKQRRIRLGMSPERYGRHIGMSNMTIRRLEAGETEMVRLTTAYKLAQDLGVEVDELFPEMMLPRVAA